jgi:serine kinase of HPr protein (carbohydrate metabolism regulator)
MKVKEIAEKLNLTLLSGEKGIQNEVTGGYVSDLLSDVMGRAGQGEIWITLQTHKNVIAIASLKDLAAVILVRGLTPDEDAAAQSNMENIPVLSTSLTAYEITGKLYELLKK